MLDSVLEFISRAASSSALVFCFCNLIIVIILVDLKPSLSIHQGSEIPQNSGNQKQGANSKSIVEKDTTSLPQAEEVSHVVEEAEAVENIEIEGNEEEEKEDDHDDEDNDDNDDELRRRVEEFIKKHLLT
ncbi:hypothetical protein CR513_18385, partial [Mucuna pruriens]